MRIALVLPTLENVGGSAQTWLNLAEGWRVLGHRPELVFVRRMGAARTPIPPGVRVVELGIPVGERFAALAEYLSESRPDLIFASTHLGNVAALLARRRARLRVPVIVHATDFVSRRVRNPEQRARVWKQMARVYPRANVIGANSGDLADEVARETGIPRARILIVPNPLDLPAIARQAAEPPAHPWFSESAEPLLLAVSALTYHKNLALLLRAFARVRARRPARLVILGEGPMRARLEALAKQLGLDADVAMPGYLANPFACMKHADLFVHTARWESFGNALAEALACGLPVVSVDCPGGPKEILDHGRAGRLVPKRSPADLAQAILETLDAPPAPETLKRRAEAFSHLAVAQRLLDLASNNTPTPGPSP